MPKEADGLPFIPPADQELQHLERKFLELIFDSVSDILFLLSAAPDIEEYRFLSVNETFLKVTGLTREQVIGKSTTEVIPKPARGLVLSKYREALNENKTVSWEEVSVYPTGKRIGEVKVTPMTDKASGQRYLVGAVHDITALREEEEALRHSEERFRAMIEHGSDIISLHESDGTMVYQSPSITTILGYGRYELLGQQVLDFIHPEDRDYTAAEINKVKSSPGVHAPFETRFRHKNGTWRWCECIGNNQLENPSVGKIIFSARDVTTRKQIEEKLQTSEANFQNVLESINEGLIITDFEDKIIYTNRRLMELTGFTLEEMTGNPAYKMLLPPELWEEMLQKNAQRSQGAGERYEHQMRRKDGNWFWAETNASPFRNQQGKIIGTIGVITDITDRKRSEEALRESEEHLRQSQKLESVGQLAGGIAHDFNNMLTAINGYSDLILRQLSPDDALRSKVEEIRKAGERAADLTHQLLAFSRKQILQPKTLNINEIVADVAKMLQRLLGEDIDLSAVLNERLGQVETDPGQIAQVIINLAINARDAMPDGGKLTIETDNVYLDENYASHHIDAPPPGRYVMLAVSDTGSGMDAETQKHIFEPFFTTKEVGKGTGMGLASVYGIVKQSGGNIWVYSEIGKGTTFKIYLPLVAKDTENIPEEPVNPVLPTGTERILLVEDEELVRHLTMEILELCGYTVIEAADGTEAIKLCEDGCKFDLLVTDVVMPNIGGRELVRRLSEIIPSLRVIYLSGYTSNSIVHHGVLDEGTNFIQKPFTPEILAQKVRDVLDEA